MKVVSRDGRDITTSTLIWGSNAVLFAVLLRKIRTMAEGCNHG